MFQAASFEIWPKVYLSKEPGHFWHRDIPSQNIWSYQGLTGNNFSWGRKVTLNHCLEGWKELKKYESSELKFKGTANDALSE